VFGAGFVSTQGLIVVTCILNGMSLSFVQSLPGVVVILIWTSLIWHRGHLMLRRYLWRQMLHFKTHRRSVLDLFWTSWLGHDVMADSGQGYGKCLRLLVGIGDCGDKFQKRCWKP
jgi:hypothetical protein